MNTRRSRPNSGRVSHASGGAALRNGTIRFERQLPPMSFDAIVLIAHGSRHESANADTRALAAELVQRGVCRFAVPAFLELAQPDIDLAGADCVQRGATSVLLLPHFLSAGVHVQRDLTAARDRLAARFPAVAFT